MADDRKPDRVAGHEIDFTWTDGPTKGETHRHRFEPEWFPVKGTFKTVR